MTTDLFFKLTPDWVLKSVEAGGFEPTGHILALHCMENRVYDLMLRCLAPHMPNLLPAGNFGSICGTVIGGPHPDTGRHFTIVEPQLGGWGGEEGRDGNSAIFSGFHGETFNCPAEVAESRYGLYVDQAALNPEDGGEGRWRGGRGIRVDYRVRADGTRLTRLTRTAETTTVGTSRRRLRR